MDKTIWKRLGLLLIAAGASYVVVRSLTGPAPAPKASGLPPESPASPQETRPVRQLPVPEPVPSARAAVSSAPEHPALQFRMPAPKYHPRPEREWQGMLVDLAIQPPCEGSAQCGMARACIGGRCGPCTADHQCAAEEVCVLDHCLLRSLASCRSRSDCRDQDSMCVLSGYTPAPRGNEKMRADCVSSRGGTPLTALEQPAPAASGSKVSEGDRLLEELRDARSRRANK